MQLYLTVTLDLATMMYIRIEQPKLNRALFEYRVQIEAVVSAFVVSRTAAV